MNSRLKRFIFSALIFPISLFAQTFPAADWKDDYDPQANPDAEIGEKLSINGSQYPKSFNYYLDNNTLSRSIFMLMYETLLDLDPITLQDTPELANKWTISEDKKTYTFHLDPAAKWSDGKPITAHDVEWTFNAVLDPKNLTGPHKISLERFAPPKVIDDHTIEFTAKEVHWKNLLSIGGFQILPKHSWEGKDFNKINFEFPVVSGRYAIGEVKESLYLRLKRRDDWWGSDMKRAEGTYNFDTVEFRFYSGQDIAYEAFKKGEIDLFEVYMSHRWIKETDGEAFDNNWIIKQEVNTNAPSGFQGFTINMRRPQFSDLRVRKALAHLLDRRKMNETLMHNQYFLHRSYYEDLFDKENPNPATLFEFDKDKARALLEDAGWKVNKENGFLEKDGQEFVINFLTRTPTSEKFLVIYKEDLADVGIQLKIINKDWAGWTKDIDEFNYDMTWASWAGGSIYKDPESLWHSKEADRKSSNNLPGYKNEEVDKLIEMQRSNFNIEERNKIYQKIDTLIAADVPYILLWNKSYDRLLYWNKFATPDTVLSKYEDSFSAVAYWSYDYDSAADLEQAMEDGAPVPAKEYRIDFDAKFQQ